MNRTDIEALPNDPNVLKRELVRQAEVIASYEAAKAQRMRDEAIAADSPAANLELDVHAMKGDLEGLSDGSGTDPDDPIGRGKVCRDAVALLDRLFAAIPRK